MSDAPRITIIVAMSETRVIGAGHGLPWRLPEDLRFFKRTTMGHPIVMGRHTHESIGGPLPGRRNLVLSRDPRYRAAGVEVFASLRSALDTCRQQEEVFVIGGAELFSTALPLATRLWLTRVHGNPPGDTWMPEFEHDGWRRTESTRHDADDRHAFAFTIERWDRDASAA